MNVSLLHAAGEKSIKPKLPLLNRAPELASWTMNIKYKTEEPKKSVEAKQGEVQKSELPFVSPNEIRTVVITKTGTTYREEVILASGNKYEKWTVNGTQLRTKPNKASIYVIEEFLISDNEKVENPDYTSFSKSDFEELTWISMENFKGVDTYQEKPVFKFESDDNKKALLSVETQLPVFYSDESRSINFVYNSAPSALLELPDNFRKILEKYKSAIESNKYHRIPM